MQVNTRIVGAGVAVAIAAGLGYVLLAGGDDEVPFETEDREGAITVRAYPGLVVAETVSEGLRDTALSRGFMTLADYVFGKERSGSRIPVMAPVLVDGDSDGRGWRTRFVLPFDRAVETLPAAGSEVRIRSLPARRVAALRFSGDTDEAVLALREAELRRWIEARGYGAAGPVEHAYYTSPFLPGPLRRNEVLIPLAS